MLEFASRHLSPEKQQRQKTFSGQRFIQLFNTLHFSEDNH